MQVNPPPIAPICAPTNAAGTEVKPNVDKPPIKPVAAPVAAPPNTAPTQSEPVYFPPMKSISSPLFRWLNYFKDFVFIIDTSA